jgi:hypothetical protein
MFPANITMTKNSLRYSTFPRTKPPAAFIPAVVSAFRKCETAIDTNELAKGLKSNDVLTQLRPFLQKLGFEIECGKSRHQKIDRPIFYGENGIPGLNYQIDAYHPEWRCGLEIEAGRGLMGNAVYRDLIQALVMVNVDHLIIAVANSYKYQITTSKKQVISTDYVKTVAVADALYGHTRMKLPYDLTVIGY